MTAAAETGAVPDLLPAPGSPAPPPPGRSWVAAYRTVGAAFVALQLLVGVTNLGFHVAMSRQLGPAGYGELVSLLAFVAILAVPAMATQTLVAASVARRTLQGLPVDLATVLRRTLAVGLATGAGLLLTAPLLRDYLNLPSIGPIVFLALGCVPMTGSVVMWALLCGQRRFLTAARIALTAAAVRIGLAAVLVSAGYGVTGAVAASTAGECVGALQFAIAVAGRQGGRSRPPRPSYPTLSAVAAVTGVWLVMCADSMLARHRFAPVVVGEYQAASTAARAVFFLAQALCLLAVPIFAGASARLAAAALRVTLLATAAAGAAAVLAFGLAGSTVASVLFGPAYHVPAGLMAWVALAGTGLSLVWVLVQFHLVRGGPAWLAWCGLAVVALAGPSLAGTPYRLAAVMSLASLVGLAAALASSWYHRTGRSPAPGMPVAMVTNAPAAGPGSLDLTVVVPYFNPGPTLRGNVLNLIGALRECGVSFEVITVADGCTDGSAETIADLDPAVVRRFSFSRNAGKGAALRLGLSQGRGRYVGFIDADGDLDPKVLHSFLSLMQLYQPDAVIGAKRHPLSEVHEGSRALRRVYSAGYRTLVRLLFPTLRVHETQVGVKVFRRELLADVLHRTVERGFVFDLELLAAAQRLGYRRILPAPVRLRRTGASTIRVPAIWRMFVGTIGLAWRVWGTRTYDAHQDDAHLERARPAEPDRLPVALSRLGFGEVW